MMALGINNQTFSYMLVFLQIASGSDDLSAIIWDWERGKQLLAFKTGHKANVFQVSAIIRISEPFSI